MVAITSRHEFTSPLGYIATPRRRAVVPSGPLRLVGTDRPVAVVRVERAPRFVLTMVLGVVAIVAMVSLMLSEPLAEPGTIPVAETTHVVADGETMWSIALDVAPAGEAATYVERLVAVNGGALVVPGQVLALPVP